MDSGSPYFSLRGPSGTVGVALSPDGSLALADGKALIEIDITDAPGFGGTVWASKLRVRGPDGRNTRVPPFDLLDVDWPIALPLIPGLDVSYGLRLDVGALGSWDVDVWVVDGVPTDVQLAADDDDVEVVIRLPFERHVLNRAGRLDTLEMVAYDTDLMGDIDSLLVLGGLAETQEWRQSRYLDPVLEQALLVLARLSRSDLINRVRFLCTG